MNSEHVKSVATLLSHVKYFEYKPLLKGRNLLSLFKHFRKIAGKDNTLIDAWILSFYDFNLMREWDTKLIDLVTLKSIMNIGLFAKVGAESIYCFSEIPTNFIVAITIDDMIEIDKENVIRKYFLIKHSLS